MPLKDGACFKEVVTGPFCLCVTVTIKADDDYTFKLYSESTAVHGILNEMMFNSAGLFYSVVARVFFLSHFYIFHFCFLMHWRSLEFPAVELGRQKYQKAWLVSIQGRSSSSAKHTVLGGTHIQH